MDQLIRASKAPLQPTGYKIGDIHISPPVVLAPMADITNGSFRRIARRIGGAGLVVTELISTAALHHGSKRSLEMFDITPDQHPVAVQLFGSDPQFMAEAAKVAEAAGADVIDINMGCWVPKVCKTGAGAAMMKDEDTACRVTEAVVNSVDLPVTVKMRAGWDYGHFATAGLAVRLQNVGVKALALHARYAVQGHTGNADWKLIQAFKSAVTVPVVGNGDVRSAADALRMFTATGCDGVMVGRGAIGNPWLLRDIAALLTTGVIPEPPTPHERVDTAIEHLRDLSRVIGEGRAVRHLRGQLPHYARGLRNAARLREMMHQAETVEDAIAAFKVLEPFEVDETDAGRSDGA